MSNGDANQYALFPDEIFSLMFTLSINCDGAASDPEIVSHIHQRPFLFGQFCK